MQFDWSKFTRQQQEMLLRIRQANIAAKFKRLLAAGIATSEQLQSKEGSMRFRGFDGGVVGEGEIVMRIVIIVVPFWRHLQDAIGDLNTGKILNAYLDLDGGSKEHGHLHSLWNGGWYGIEISFCWKITFRNRDLNEGLLPTNHCSPFWITSHCITILKPWMILLQGTKLIRVLYKPKGEMVERYGWYNGGFDD